MLFKHGNCTRLPKIKNKLKIGCFTNKVGKNSQYFEDLFYHFTDGGIIVKHVSCKQCLTGGKITDTIYWIPLVVCLFFCVVFSMARTFKNIWEIILNWIIQVKQWMYSTFKKKGFEELIKTTFRPVCLHNSNETPFQALQVYALFLWNLF